MTASKWVLLAILLVVLAGCGAPADPDIQQPMPTDTSTTNPEPKEADVVVTKQIIWWNDTLPVGACVPNGISDCIVVRESYADWRIPLEGLQGFNGSAVLSWDSTLEGLDRLELFVGKLFSCGDGCFGLLDYERVIGSSPLSVDFAFGDGAGIGLHVRAGSTLPDPLYGFIRSETAFTLQAQVALTCRAACLVGESMGIRSYGDDGRDAAR